MRRLSSTGSRPLTSRVFAFVLGCLALGATGLGCKQGLGDRCEINSDCSSGICNNNNAGAQDPGICTDGTGTTGRGGAGGGGEGGAGGTAGAGGAGGTTDGGEDAPATVDATGAGGAGGSSPEAGTSDATDAPTTTDAADDAPAGN